MINVSFYANEGPFTANSFVQLHLRQKKIVSITSEKFTLTKYSLLHYRSAISVAGIFNSLSKFCDHIVWIVEDDLDDRILLKEAFLDAKISCSVSVFPDAIIALQQLSVCRDENLPTTIVSDYNMPLMNGADFIQALCKHTRYDMIRKVILSTSSYLFSKEECVKKGANAYFVKPSHYSQLIDVAYSILTMST